MNFAHLFTLAVRASLLVFAAGLLTANAQDKTLLQTAQEQEGLAQFLAAVKKADLEGALTGKEALTVFAPNDEAFKKLGKIEDLSKEKLTRVLQNHLLKGKTNLGIALASGKVTTLLGTDHPVVIEGGGIKLGTAGMKKANVECGNGYLNIIDTVLVPESKSLADVAKEAGTKQLLEALKTTGLDKAIAGDGPFTIFAPTDEAFKKAGDIPADKLENLLKNHVVKGRVTLADLLAGKKVTTLAGNELSGVLDGVIKVGGVQVAKPDLSADNGILHLIEGVIVPTEKGARDHAAELIARSIEIGSALYNGRNPAGCADVYELTMQAVQELGTDLPAGVDKALADARSKADEEKEDAAQAWVLRKGLDAAHELLAR